MDKNELLEIAAEFLPSNGTWDSPDINSDEAIVSLGDCLDILDRCPDCQMPSVLYGARAMLRNAVRRIAHNPDSISEDWDPMPLWHAPAGLPAHARQRLDDAIVEESCDDSDHWYSVWALAEVCDYPDTSAYTVQFFLDFGFGDTLCVAIIHVAKDATEQAAREALAPVLDLWEV